MPTVSFAALDRDDAGGDLTKATWPVTGGTYTDTQSYGELRCQKTYVPATPLYSAAYAMVRFDTSALPADAQVTRVVLKFHVTYIADVQGLFSVVAEYYQTWLGGGTSVANWIETVVSNIATPKRINTFQVGVVNSLSITDYSGIMLDGTTGFRLTLSAGTPTGENTVVMASSEHATLPTPVLELDYTTGTTQPPPQQPPPSGGGLLGAALSTAAFPSGGTLGQLLTSAPYDSANPRFGATLSTISFPPAASVSSGSKLAFPPPVLSSPVTINIPDTGAVYPAGGGSFNTVQMRGDTDYIINIGHRQIAAGQNQEIILAGHRNLILRSGRQTLSLGSADDQSQRHGIRIINTSGHTFIEGFLWDGNPLRALIFGEGIDGSTMTIQNCRIEGTYYWAARRGGPDTQHSDVWMTWGSNFLLQCDKNTWEYDNTGLAYYGGMRNDGPNRSDLRRCNLRSIWWYSGNFQWIDDQTQRATAENCYATLGHYGAAASQGRALQDTYGRFNNYTTATGNETNGWLFTPYTVVSPSLGRTIVVRTQADHDAFGSVNVVGQQQGDYIDMDHPMLLGNRWHCGIPPGGDFVPAGLAGQGYVSPGYF